MNAPARLFSDCVLSEYISGCILDIRSLALSILKILNYTIPRPKLIIMHLIYKSTSNLSTKINSDFVTMHTSSQNQVIQASPNPKYTQKTASRKVLSYSQIGFEPFTEVIKSPGYQMLYILCSPDGHLFL